MHDGFYNIYPKPYLLVISDRFNYILLKLFSKKLKWLFLLLLLQLFLFKLFYAFYNFLLLLIELKVWIFNLFSIEIELKSILEDNNPDF